MTARRPLRSAVSLANSLPDSKIVNLHPAGNDGGLRLQLASECADLCVFANLRSVPQAEIINWGTYPHYLSFDPNPNRTIGSAINTLLAAGLAKSGDHLVIVSDMLAGEERFDTIQLRVVP